MGKIFDNLFRIYRIGGRLAIKYSANPRPASPPYVTGDGFRNFADFNYDGTVNNLEPDIVKPGSIIFVGDSNIKKFLTEIHPKIKAPYTLITHNGDEAITAQLASLVDEKIIRWYGINVLVNHPKIVPLPLGIANKHFYVTGIPWLFKQVHQKNYQKKDRLFYGFTVGTLANERQPALDILQKHPLTETVSAWLNFYDYLHLLGHYKVVVSPPGSCVEGHRTWDALYLGVVPIVKRSITTEYFVKLGIPLWQIDDWSELPKINEKTIDEKYHQLIDNFDRKAIELDYWLNKIKNNEN